MNKFNKLSVVILCYKSEEKIIEFVDLVEKVIKKLNKQYEIILVANYKKSIVDKTPSIVRELSKNNKNLVPVILEKKGMMGWDAISGLKVAKGDAIALIDGDGQMPPEDLGRLFRIMLSGEFDFVKTFRIN